MDELLSVESLDEKRKFAEYETEVYELFRNGWLDATAKLEKYKTLAALYK